MYLNIFFAMVIFTKQENSEVKRKEGDAQDQHGVISNPDALDPGLINTPRRPRRQEEDSAMSVVVSIKSEAEAERENQDSEGELPRWWELPNIILAHLSLLVSGLDFEGQSARLEFILDSADMALNLCCVVMVVIRVILELKIKERLTKIAIADVVLTLICLGGMIYEAIIASDFDEFLAAETMTGTVLRSFKCLKLILLLFERKYYWKELHDFIMVYKNTLSRVLQTFCLWLIIMLVAAIMGHHIQGGRVLVNEEGEPDADGRPNRFNFEDIYHSFIFILLDSFDEEWDFLMFKEYLGTNPVVVGFQMVVMLVCYLLCFKYFTGSFTNELDHVFSEAKDEDEKESQSEADLPGNNEGFSKAKPSTEEAKAQEEDPEQHQCCRGWKEKLKSTVNGRAFVALKVIVILSVCVALAYFTPKLKPNQTETAILKAISISSFVFFLLETIACISVYGFVRGKDTYLRRDYVNILNLTLLIMELLDLTPLSENATFHSVAKLKALRILLLVQLVYERSPQMKLIFQAFIRSLPFMMALLLGILLFFSWCSILQVKLYKDDEYYCDNAYISVKTKQECFEWGGDWVKHKLNFSSYLHLQLFAVSVTTMEDLLSEVMLRMDLSGKDRAP